MKKDGNPFSYEITNITNESFTVKWNDISKLAKVSVNLYDDIDATGEVVSKQLDLSTGTFTFTKLKENVTYFLDLITNFKFDLQRNYYFAVKTLGEDAVAEKANIKNETLSEEVAKELGVFERPVSVKDMEYLYGIYVNDKNIDSLVGLELATNLERLEFAYNNIESIQPLEGLTDISYIYMPGNEIVNIDSLINLTNLREIHLDYNNITDISSLRNLSNLEILYLDYNGITNIEALENLTQLYTLSLSGNEINSIDSLSKLTELDDLKLNHTNISDITPLRNLKHLTTLSLYSNNITNVTTLAELQYLQYLDLDSNHITDIAPLNNLSHLERLYLSYNNIKVIPELMNLTNVTNLYLAGNPLTDISNLVWFTNLSVLDLSDTDIANLTILKQIPSLQTVYLYDANISDKKTIEWLENDGVNVYYNETHDEDEDLEVDWDEVYEAFPDQTFYINEVTNTVELNLDEHGADSAKLSPNQIRVLRNNGLNIKLSKKHVSSTIPASVFKNSDEEAIITVNETGREDNSYSSTYDFTIKQGNKTIRQFEDGVTLTFQVNPERAKNPTNLKVFHYNEAKGKW